MLNLPPNMDCTGFIKVLSPDCIWQQTLAYITYMLCSHICQADLLRQQTLQQMNRILTTRQTARALLAISDYFSRLRALSSLWVARPRD